MVAGTLFDRIAEYYDALHEDVDYAGNARSSRRSSGGFSTAAPPPSSTLGAGPGATR